MNLANLGLLIGLKFHNQSPFTYTSLSAPSLGESQRGNNVQEGDNTGRKHEAKQGELKPPD